MATRPHDDSTDDYRVHVVNTLASIQAGVTDLQRSVTAIREYVDARFFAEREHLTEELRKIDERVRSVEAAQSIYKILAVVGTLIIGLVSAVLVIVFEKTMKAP